MHGDTFDKSSTLNIDGEVLNRSSFKKTADEKLARRVGNEPSDPLHVTLTEGVGENDLLVYDSISAVDKDDETLILSYIVPPTNTFNLDKVTCSGENIGTYTVKVDDDVVKVLRTNYGGSLNAIFDFRSYELNAGQKLEVFILQRSNQGASIHNATIEGKII